MLVNLIELVRISNDLLSILNESHRSKVLAKPSTPCPKRTQTDECTEIITKIMLLKMKYIMSF